MKLSKLYANDEARFRDVVFRPGLNVVVGVVSDRSDLDKNSHNLGKTLLAHLLDFTLLKGFSRGHFLYDNRELFRPYVFFLELELNDGEFVTIRRSVAEPSKVSLRRHSDHHADCRDMQEQEWFHHRLPFQKGKKALDEILGLDALRGYSYRTGVGYFLRTQRDYLDVFQLARFSRGKDREWKPYLADLLGLSGDILREKFELDEQIERVEAEIGHLEGTAGYPSKDYDKLVALIQVKSNAVESLRAGLDRFNFANNEELGQQRLKELEDELSLLNRRRYTAEFESSRISEALNQKVSFDAERVRKLFAEAEVALGDKLVRDYSELVEFKRRMLDDRAQRLTERLATLESTNRKMGEQAARLNKEREDLLRGLSGAEVFEKYRAHQKSLTREEVELDRLRTGKAVLDNLEEKEDEVKNLRENRRERRDAIRASVRGGSEKYDAIRSRFSQVVKQVLSRDAIISISPLETGNLEFAAKFVGEEGASDTTSEDKGTSFRQILCVAFDIAVLEAYAAEMFFRFVYHDGVFERLDPRKKERLVSVVREYCETYGLQYVLSAIESDLPGQATDVLFDADEVILRLHDRGDNGRLFRMPTF